MKPLKSNAAQAASHSSHSFLSSDESGQATVEYILLLSLVAVAALGVFSAVRTAVDDGVVIMGAELQRNLKTGRAPASVFRDN